MIYDNVYDAADRNLPTNSVEKSRESLGRITLYKLRLILAKFFLRSFCDPLK